MSRAAPFCMLCKHFQYGEDPVCVAFPGGIPHEIFYKGATHFEPYPGDRGVQFAPRNEAEWQRWVAAYGEPEPRGPVPDDLNIFE